MVTTNSETNAGGRLRIRHIGGPTALIEIGGVRLLTDPTFDPPGDYLAGSRVLTKTAGPALSADELGPVDAVLLSHDQHADNLDRSGREYLARVPLVLSTAAAQERMDANVRALPNWESIELPRPDGGRLRITGLPALHGPEGSEHLVGEVSGFALSGEGLPSVYVSGDNASLAVVRSIVDRLGSFDVALLFAGRARTALLGEANLTLSSEEAVEAARLLGAKQVAPVHFEGWAHFTNDAETLRAAFAKSDLADRLRLLTPGEQIEL